MGISPNMLAQKGIYKQNMAVGRSLWGYEGLPLQKEIEGAGDEMPLYVFIYHIFLPVLKALSKQETP